MISQEHRERVSYANKGREVTELTREKLRVANTGRILTPEHIEKVRQTSLGRHHTAETKAKLKGIKSGVPRPDMLGNRPGNSIEVLLWTKDSTLPRIFSTAKSAANYLGISYDTVRRHIVGTYRGIELPIAICEA